jgi:hypothetical protein
MEPPGVMVYAIRDLPVSRLLTMLWTISGIGWLWEPGGESGPPLRNTRRGQRYYRRGSRNLHY